MKEQGMMVAYYDPEKKKIRMKAYQDYIKSIMNKKEPVKNQSSS